ncbi:MAG: glycyl-radical enzyme activating protein [Deltaproteobacteria bacterium]|nr:glycyl-radical enzyme activating protein [Deltaproteobacteria bacterium]
MALSTDDGAGRGLVFDIQRFSIHDGPGIRTTVFMKGCPLRCLWCANPESQDFSRTLMVRDIQCRACGACARTCPEGAITMSREEGRVIDWDRCTQCLKCAEACLYESLTVCGRYMTVDEVLEEVMKDEIFYKNSGGGLTLSGGEALAQPEFTWGLLQACRGKGLHTALDTTGYAPWETVQKVLDWTDLILFDVKHLDTIEHQRTTGVGNELILENLKRVATRRPVWIRMPLIAGFNDSASYADEIASLALRVQAEKISLLPYHEGGKSKSRQMGRTYRFEGGEAPDDDHVQTLKSLIEGRGVTVSIGS